MHQWPYDLRSTSTFLRIPYESEFRTMWSISTIIFCVRSYVTIALLLHLWIYHNVLIFPCGGVIKTRKSMTFTSPLRIHYVVIASWLVFSRVYEIHTTRINTFALRPSSLHYVPTASSIMLIRPTTRLLRCLCAF